MPTLVRTALGSSYRAVQNNPGGTSCSSFQKPPDRDDGLPFDSVVAEVKSRGGSLHIDTLNLIGTKTGDLTQVKEQADLLVDAVDAVFSGKVESDALNQLVISAGLSWQQVDVFRSYIEYMNQIH